MKRACWRWLGVAGLAVALAGCGGKKSAAGDDHDHDHDHGADHGGETGEAGDGGGVAFREGRGLQLSPEVVRALGVRTGEAAERSLADEFSFSAQVFATQPRVLAGARLPDITNVQVQINTAVPSLAPEEIEKLVTYPIEVEMGGIEKLLEVRSLSKFGLSQVTLIFQCKDARGLGQSARRFGTIRPR
jgi:hypothetical protein